MHRPKKEFYRRAAECVCDSTEGFNGRKLSQKLTAVMEQVAKNSSIVPCGAAVTLNDGAPHRLTEDSPKEFSFSFLLVPFSRAPSRLGGSRGAQ
jgi:hypothetical protein